MWQHRSPPGQIGEVRGHGTRGSVGARLDRELRSGAVGCVIAPEPITTGRLGSRLQDTWQHVHARPAPCLDLKPVCGGIRSIGYRQWPPGPPRERL
jgi:hypothetical protein